MRILLATNWLRIGGIETNIVRLTTVLCRCGHDVTVAAAGGPLVERVRAAGGRFHEVALDRLGSLDIRNAVRRLSAIVRDRQIEIIHAFSASSAAALRLARLHARFHGRPWPPVVASIMGLRTSPGELPVITYARALVTTLGAERVFVISPEIGRLVDRLPVPRTRVFECPVVGVETDLGTGVTAAQMQAVRAELGIPPAARVVLTIGNLVPSKSHELFVRAAAKVSEVVPDARFLVVGEGHQRAWLEAEVDRLGLKGRVQLIGPRSDIPVLLSLCDVYVRPGILDGFVGITVLEAQVVGCPVVSFDTIDVRPAVMHERTGLLVPPGDTDGLAKAMLRLLADGSLRRSLAVAARQHVERRFSMRAVVSSLEAAYGEVLRRRLSPT
ncbi:MAG: glycosyltransferase family 4 protein [Actinobacteria bacterium]|nr:glycosyltransferase family 4 protein [Actinomycetota bacterium]